MNLIRVIERATIAIYSFGNSFIKKRNKKNNKNILIIFQQIFGDAIVFSKALDAYTRLYPARDGYKITFIARPSVIAFMKATVSINDEIDIQPVDFKKIVDNYKYFKEVVNRYKDYADTIIVPGTSFSAELLSCSLNANRKVGLVRCVPVKKPFIMAWFYRRAYTEKVVPSKEDMMLQRHRILLNYLGLKNYKATLPKLLNKEKIIKDVRYVVCCPGSSKMEKCWPTERFCEVIDYIIENYDMPVYLCGGFEEKAFESIIFSTVKHPEKITSYIGKTSFSEWSSIVQYSTLTIGNDSATMHLAVAASVPSVCIAGVYDKYQFFPYKVDKINDGEILPVTLYKDFPCEWCRTIGYDAGYGNDACKKRIKNNKCALCIDAITTEEIIIEINKILG